MSSSKGFGPSRRGVLKATAASALAGVVLPQVHAGGDEIIKVALVGCGGRGTGAAANALNVESGQTRLVAMADAYADRLNRSHDALQRSNAARMDVPAERKFVGFDGYRQAMDSLRAGDIVILTTPPAFRWAQFTYAIEKGLHVFMEKPITVDGPSTRRMLALGEQATRRNLKVAVGLMCRHCDARKELAARVKDGAIGDLTMLRAYRVAGPIGSAHVGPKPADMNELEFQIRNFHAFLWASGGAFSDFLIHNIDEACWMKDAFPVSAKGYGGRHYRGNNIDQNFDTYSVEYTFADGTKLFLEGRTMQGCAQEFATYIHGTRGSAIVSTSGHTPARPRIFRGQNQTNNADVVWRFGQNREPDPYQLEWNHLLDAIRADRPYSEVQRGAEASLATAMGRMACHTGQIITRDQMLACEHEFAPEVDRLTRDSAAPVVADAQGKYPVPRPGQETRREY
ncbi:MAG: Gfo/Idh/MocA family oxidoreductase [Planctomycetota bacterium]|jgi:predicted dehydrogenase